VELLRAPSLNRAYLERAPKPKLALWLIAAICLALTSAAYGALVGPLMRAAFSDQPWELPPLLSTALSGLISRPQLSLLPQELRAALPWGIAAVATLKSLSYLVERYTLASLAIDFSHRQRRAALRGLSSLSVDEYELRGTGALQRLLSADIELLERWVVEGWAPMIRDGLQVITLAGTALLVSGELGLWVLLCYPLFIAPILSLRRYVKSITRGELHELRRFSQWLHDQLSTIWVARFYISSDQAELRRAEAHEELGAAQRGRALLLALTPPLTELLSALAIAFGLSYFLDGIARGRWAPEQLIALFVCLIMMYAPLKSVARAHPHWVRARDVLQQLRELEAHKAEPIELVKQAQESLPARRFCWRDVELTRGGAPLGIRLAEITVSRGQILRLEGPNGGGKSSLIYQLLGLNLSAPGQRLLLDGIELASPQLLIERRLVSWVPQASPLPHADPKELSALLPQSFERSGALSALFKDPKLDRLVDGELSLEELRGLSGGERQKCALHIALSQARPLLVLDEPEVHLDESSVERLAYYLKTTRAQRALIIITHHPKLAALSELSLRVSR